MTDTQQSWWYVFDEQTRILVVDDDPILLEFASVYLTTPMSVVALAPDASTALDLLARDQFDIALIDIDMPGMNGFELTECIRGQDKLRNLPIVMVTGREDIVSIDRAYGAGATSFVTKPVNWRQLSHQLRYVIRAGKQQPAAAPPQDTSPPRNGSATWMSAGTRREFATSLGSIINAAKRIANGRVPSQEGAQEIIAAAETLLLKSVVHNEQEGHALTFLRPAQQSLPRAS
jgi:two-component system, sensor histidine kinase and response regulator